MVSKGFPQGSGLSPLLFNIFFRNLPRHGNATVFQFTDDTTLTAEHRTLSVVADKCTESFDKVKEFCNSHDLKD